MLINRGRRLTDSSIKQENSMTQFSWGTPWRGFIFISASNNSSRERENRRRTSMEGEKALVGGYCPGPFPN